MCITWLRFKPNLIQRMNEAQFKTIWCWFWDLALVKNYNSYKFWQEFHETLHSLLLWLAHAESRRYAVNINHPETTVKALKQHRNTLTVSGLLMLLPCVTCSGARHDVHCVCCVKDLQEELQRRQTQQASLHALWSQLQPDHTEDSHEAQEKLHVTGSKMKILLKEVTEDLRTIQQRLVKIKLFRIVIFFQSITSVCHGILNYSLGLERNFLSFFFLFRIVSLH